MPRPPDTYTHGQFSVVESDNKGETVQCNHCKQWTGNIKTLNRKKDHLLKCPRYAAWRQAGNGQDLAPPNSYNKRDSNGAFGSDDPYNSPYGAAYPDTGPTYTPTMARNRYDVSKSFEEFWDDSTNQKVFFRLNRVLGLFVGTSKLNKPIIKAVVSLVLTGEQCMRVRCLHCGFVRAKNTTRQVEHLSECREFLNSTEGQQAVASGNFVPMSASSQSGPDIWRGGAPNPNLQGMINRRGPNKPRASMAPPTSTPSRAPKPSLAQHLTNRVNEAVVAATQKSFLSHAGCGTLSAATLNQWLAQAVHISRALVPFVGALIGKVRIPETNNLTSDSTFRALDLLCSAVNNMKKELEFLESTKRKYDLNVTPEEPHPATRGFIDLFAGASSPQSSLLEGLVVLWATEHCFCTSFQYAATFMSTMPASSSYSLPSYLTPSQGGPNMYGTSQQNGDNSHVTALHEAFIQNWTSANFVRFVSACKSIVDEVANAQTTGDGRAQMNACERAFRQAVWLWDQVWPDVDGMGEEEDLAETNAAHDDTAGANGDKPIEVDDDMDADAAADSPYGGTGLGAVAAHVRESAGPQ